MAVDRTRWRRPRRIGFWYRLAAVILRPIFMVLTKRDWHGAEHLPPHGTGVIVVTNHVSHVDPITFAHFLFDKQTLMAIPGADGSFETRNPRHEPGDPTHPGIDRDHAH